MRSPELRFPLPPGWATVPLADRDETNATLRRIVAGRVPASHGATVRRELLRRLIAGADLARADGGRSMHLGDGSRMGSLLVAERGVPAPASPIVLAEGLVVALERVGRACATCAGPGVPAVRTLRAESVDGLPMLAADYWIPRPDGEAIVIASFLRAGAVARRPSLARWDSIVAAGTWTSDDPSGECAPRKESTWPTSM